MLLPLREIAPRWRHPLLGQTRRRSSSPRCRRIRSPAWRGLWARAARSTKRGECRAAACKRNIAMLRRDTYIVSNSNVSAERFGMARVTVEDCVLKVPNRFELVLLAAQRARDIAAGGTLTRRSRQRQEPGRRAARDRRRDGSARRPAERAHQGHAEACRDRRARGGPRVRRRGHVAGRHRDGRAGMSERGRRWPSPARKRPRRTRPFAEDDAALDEGAADLGDLPDGTPDEEP